ncbi:S-adenosyl-L-methionine-dependent methyltransferase [Hygrophoropsis aurantiaca]|uniref:S-adenosyl-L-methionine-dependent methyltransferase n=1 Tax=Hygrophoropsis aurantiaca TaxID=72124 RepID=A0ACB8A7P8_9AGAM|nr:S-adenosyl-L-methionine-dependent methyltransferase [Hygrophoropsis aurantiaca]
MDPKEIVRTGYDALSFYYRPEGDYDGVHAPHHKVWATQLISLLSFSSSSARVLDLGCGCGVPVARDLARAGHTVVGVDISAVQIARARELVPGGTFIQADITAFARGDSESSSHHGNTDMGGEGEYDAVVALYVLIHLPVAEQEQLIARMGRWVKDDGLCMLTVGISAQTFERTGWLGSGEEVRMWWQQAGVGEYRAWLGAAGFEIVEDKVVKDLRAGEEFEGHQFLLVRRLPRARAGVGAG